MTLEQLRIFVAVAEREHVTQAARDLHLTQSATSAAVAALEARYGVRLFDRVGRGVALTDAGRIFLGEARAVLSRAAAAETILSDLSGMRRGTLGVAASQTVANYWLPSRLARYRLLYPGIDVAMTIGNTRTVAAMVHEGAADIGLVEGRIDDPHLSIRPIADDELVLVVGAAHAWAGRSGVALADLSGATWVLREQGSGTRSMFEAVLNAAGAQLSDFTVALELPSNEAVRAAVEAGAGVAVMSSLVAGPSIRAGSLVRLDLALPKRQFSALRHRERATTHAARAFEALLFAPGENT